MNLILIFYLGFSTILDKNSSYKCISLKTYQEGLDFHKRKKEKRKNVLSIFNLEKKLKKKSFHVYACCVVGKLESLFLQYLERGNGILMVEVRPLDFMMALKLKWTAPSSEACLGRPCSGGKQWLALDDSNLSNHSYIYPLFFIAELLSKVIKPVGSKKKILF